MNKRGFTIVELLVVIVVIGILAAITIVTYTGISNKAIISSLQSDLTSASKQLKLYYVDNGYYPTNISSNCPTPTDNRYCLKPSGSNTFAYSATPTGSTSPQAFRLTATNNTISYATTNTTKPSIVTTATSCPTGFIPVPGSGTYGTNDFCVMKYEAKQVGATTTPVSQAAGTPWVSISQTAATANSPNVADCTGCHLITEAEWLTITQNVLSVPSNWNGGVVGTSYIYSGHNDNAPANTLAVTNTADGYSDTGNVTPSNQRRALTLSNGEVIWDLAGNVLEWTSGTSTIGQPGITGGGYAWREWTAITNLGTILLNPNPSTTGILNANNWTSTNGIGKIYSNADQSVLRGFIRGGYWEAVSGAGVLALDLSYGSVNSSSTIGFRVSR